MAAFRTLDQLDPRGKRVLVRVDFNVPMQDGEVTDATRIERAATTLKELTEQGREGRRALAFRPAQGQARDPMSLRADRRSAGPGAGPAGRLRAGLRRRARPKRSCDAPADGGVALLENLRFHAGEEKNDPAFAEQLAELGDIYVNDAFSASHRAHASTPSFAELLPAYAGRLMQAELEALRACARQAGSGRRRRVIGGAKVSTKLDVLGHLLDRSTCW